MENIIITNREAYLVEEKTNNENSNNLNKYEYISENNEEHVCEIPSQPKDEKQKNKKNFKENFDCKSISSENQILSKKSFCEKSEILSLQSNSSSNNMKDSLTTNENENESHKKINPKNLIKAYIGHVSEAHHYILDNEFILKGYRINFHSCKKISSSLCLCHNETINIWTHFIGAVLIILFMFLVVFNLGPINPESSLKSYFEKKARGNFTQSFFAKSALNCQDNSNNLSNDDVNSGGRIQFEIRNNFNNDDNNNNFEKLKKANDLSLKENKNTSNSIRIMEYNGIESVSGLFSEKIKLKLLNNFDSETIINYEAEHNLIKNGVEKGRKFIENYNDGINKNDNNKNDEAENTKLRKFPQQFNDLFDFDSMIYYLKENFLDHKYFSIDFKNKTQLYIDNFNNVFIYSINKIIEKFNEIKSTKLKKNISMTEFSNLAKLKDFLLKILNHLNNLTTISKQEITFNLRILQESKESILSNNENLIEANEETLTLDESITPKWPVLIHLVSALFCLSCSTTFHLFSAYSSKVGDVLSRLDYAGISVLIAGSCFPPYYYMFCCTKLFLTLYLTFICTFAIIVFSISLMSKFNTPDYRRLRGFLFLSLGISTALPLFHYIFLFDESLGMIKELKVTFWAVGGIIYISGCLIYIARFPERICPGKFDLIGSSHQIWHIFVVSGVVFHHVASITNYHDRLSQGCPNIR